ncbi:MAG: TonB family protein [Chitinivibrionales bacterium]|nr:TonB family protein [Chitinivibrionales bacterium]
MGGGACIGVDGADCGTALDRFSLLRFAIAWLLACVCVYLFCIVTITGDYSVKTAPPPYTVVNIMEILPEKPPPPVPSKSVERPNRVSTPPAEKTPEPVSQEPEPDAPSDIHAAAGDKAGDYQAIRKASVLQPVTPAALRIESPKELDNIEFDPIFNPKPLYPDIALRAGIEGWVDVDLIIDEKGMVHSFIIDSIFGHPSFAEAAEEALPRWRFPPPRQRGRSVRVKYYYRINFTLD